MSGSVGASLSRRFSRKFLAPVLATGFFLGVSMVVAGAVSAQQSEQMHASYYGPGFEGATTASGEPFDPNGYTAAHKTLPFGTVLEVCYQGCVTVRVNDRGPFVAGRDLDLAQGAADAIGLTAVGHDFVDVTYLDASAPLGPSSGGTAPQQPAPEQPAPEQSVPSQSVSSQQNQQNQGGGAASQQVTNEQYADDQVTNEQYADDQVTNEQYADDQYTDDSRDVAFSRDQYDNAADEQYSPPVADREPNQVVAPVVPAPEELEVAPLELATPGSTVERRIQLAEAAAPESYAGPLPEAEPAAVVETAPEPQPEPQTVPEPGSVAAVAGLTVLPDTGGLPVIPIAGGALALGLMLLGVRAIRR